jgi:hypothetical protein
MDVTRCGGRGGRAAGLAFERAIRLAGSIPIGCTAGAAAAGFANLRAGFADPFADFAIAGAAIFARDDCEGFMGFAVFATVAGFAALAVFTAFAIFGAFAVLATDFFGLAAARAFALAFGAALAFTRAFGFAAFRLAFDFGLGDAPEPGPRRALADRPAADFFTARLADFFALPAPDLRLIAISLYLPSGPRGGGIMHLRRGGAPLR